jgi:hypothetical protein
VGLRKLCRGIVEGVYRDSRRVGERASVICAAGLYSVSGQTVYDGLHLLRCSLSLGEAARAFCAAEGSPRGAYQVSPQ